MSCVVWGCGNNSISSGNSSIHYYVFPKQPEIAQQWIEACGWPPGELDLNTARICSIHFSEDSYTTEVKLIEYMTCYTKVLKFDAVPTLYLPVTRLIIQKGDTQEELREMILFASEHEPIQNPGLITLNKIEENNEETVNLQDSNIEKYKHIQSREALGELIIENKTIAEQVIILENDVKKLKASLLQKMENYKEKDVTVSNLHNEYLQTRQNFLSAQQQKVLLGKVFSESQIKILSGKKKIYWSNDDMAVGYTIRHLSNKRCYMYLTKKLNIPLPAVSSIKRWMNLKNVEKKGLSVAVKKRTNTNEDDSD